MQGCQSVPGQKIKRHSGIQKTHDLGSIPTRYGDVEQRMRA